MYSTLWKSLSASEKRELAEQVGTTANYLRHVMYGRKQAGFKLAVDLHKATNGEISKSVLRPDIYPL